MLSNSEINRKQLTVEDVKVLYFACSLKDLPKEEQEKIKKEVDEIFLSKILNKRVEAFRLPLSFDASGLVIASLFCRSPAAAIVLLIDCLEKGEKLSSYPLITVDSLVMDVYPSGFYTDEALRERIDYIKECKEKGLTEENKWFDIY